MPNAENSAGPAASAGATSARSQILWISAACVVLLAGIGWLVFDSIPKQAAVTPTDNKPAPGTTDSNKPPEEEIPLEGGPRQILACYHTRRGSTPFQVMTAYKQVRVPVERLLERVPDFIEALGVMADRGQRLPREFLRVDQEMEKTIDTLGEKRRNMASYTAYIDPYTGEVIAYDLALTEGGVPQRFIGRLSKAGIMLRVYQGGEQTDQNEITFPTNTHVLPPRMDFIRVWFQRHPEIKEPVRWSLFIPEASTFVGLVARPLGTETIPVQGRKVDCARYDVEVRSTQAREDVVSYQRMWFDLREGVMVKRLDYEEDVQPDDARVTERIASEDREAIQYLALRPPELPEAKPFPYPLDRDLVYFVKARDKKLGKVRVRFSRQDADNLGPGGYVSIGQVLLDAQGSTRNETAVTRLDSRFLPIAYRAEGDEEVETKAKYRVEALFTGGRTKIEFFRDIQAAIEGASPANPERVGSRPLHGDDEPEPSQIPGVPLRLVSLKQVEEEAEPPPAARARKVHHALDRPLDEGTFLYDFHRVEHLALLALRLPVPNKAPEGKDQGALIYQRAAMYSIRRNLGGILTFRIRPEPRPEAPKDDPDLAEDLEEENEQLWIAHTGGALLPCQMLLTSDGRLLQLTCSYGSGEVTYTLDDPIMHRRERNAQKRRGQEGPTLLRPPWF